jgi:hypothetical protein
LINILYDALTGNFPRLCRTQFAEVAISLKAFDGKGSCELRIQHVKDNMVISLSDDRFEIPLAPFRHFGDDPSLPHMPIDVARRAFRFDFDLRELQVRLRSLVPAVWLPVSRRLPIAEEEEIARRPLHRKPLESVDECLSALIDSLQQYRLSLNTELSDLRKEFQRHALENILYDKQHDRMLLRPHSETPPSEEDKQALLQAFRDVGLVDRQMESRINDHFSAAKDALTRLAQSPTKIEIETLFIIPLLSRTRAIVSFAQELETKRETLFSALHTYEKIVNSFLRACLEIRSCDHWSKKSTAPSPCGVFQHRWSRTHGWAVFQRFDGRTMADHRGFVASTSCRRQASHCATAANRECDPVCGSHGVPMAALAG